MPPGFTDARAASRPVGYAAHPAPAEAGAMIHEPQTPMIPSTAPVRPIGGAAGEAAGYLFEPSADLIDRREVVGFGEPDFYVRTIDRQLANDTIMANHYSRRIYRASTLHLGVFVGGRFLGVLQYGFAMNPASAGSVVAGTAMNEYLELNRMWLDDEWIQSFADERCGLFGTVYQAAGFTFHGEHMGAFYELDGEFYHTSLVTKSSDNGPRATKIKTNLHRATLHKLRQFRYLRFLKPRFAKGCRHPVRPFPKPSYENGAAAYPLRTDR